MRRLEGRVAVVAGGSRGAGRGIAVALGEAGATVYVLGRTTRAGPAPGDGAPGTIEETAAEVSARGGTGVAVRADCTVVEEVAAAFERVAAERGRLDVLANAVWGAADAMKTLEDFTAAWSRSYWEQPVESWRGMMTAGPYAYWLTGWHATRLMKSTGGGLIVGVTDGVFAVDGEPASDAAGSGGQLLWDLAHGCINRLQQGMAAEAAAHGIAVVTLMPGFMRTERVLMHVKTEEQAKMFRLDRSETPEYLGRAVAALAADPEVMAKSGRIHFVADLAQEYGFTDVDGRRVPRFNPFG
jgi:NAD(P)-dependent dehydrogenase (short-subunit alcohol dehydrogenase family)